MCGSVCIIRRDFPKEMDMSDTKRRLTLHNFRRPHKNIQFKDIEHVRVGAVPPTEHDDIHYSRECYLGYRLVRKLINQGLTDQEIVETLLQKHKVSAKEALKLTQYLRR